MKGFVGFRVSCLGSRHMIPGLGVVLLGSSLKVLRRSRNADRSTYCSNP